MTYLGSIRANNNIIQFVYSTLSSTELKIALYIMYITSITPGAPVHPMFLAT